MRCLILDDEPLAIRLLQDYAARHPQLTVALATTDVFAALKKVQDGEIDLAFLDIQMPELTGIQFMKIVQGRCKVVVTTAYPDYALQGYELDVVDYLLKPFSPERFDAAVQKAVARTSSKPEALPVSVDHFFVKSEYKMLKLLFADVVYLEALRDYVAIHTTKGKVLTLQSLRSFEEQLPPAQFVRIHKSYIVPISRVTAVEKKLLHLGQLVLPIGDAYMESFRQRLAI